MNEPNSQQEISPEQKSWELVDDQRKIFINQLVHKLDAIKEGLALVQRLDDMSVSTFTFSDCTFISEEEELAVKYCFGDFAIKLSFKEGDVLIVYTGFTDRQIGPNGEGINKGFELLEAAVAALDTKLVIIGNYSIVEDDEGAIKVDDRFIAPSKKFLANKKILFELADASAMKLSFLQNLALKIMGVLTTNLGIKKDSKLELVNLNKLLHGDESVEDWVKI